MTTTTSGVTYMFFIVDVEVDWQDREVDFSGGLLWRCLLKSRLSSAGGGRLVSLVRICLY